MNVLDRLKNDRGLQAFLVGIGLMIAAFIFMDVRGSQIDCARGVRSACTLTITPGFGETVSHDLKLEDIEEVAVTIDRNRVRSGGSTRTSTCYRAELVTRTDTPYALTNCEVTSSDADKVAAPINEFLAENTMTSAQAVYNPYTTPKFFIWFGGGLLMTLVGGFFAFRKKPAKKKKSKAKADTAGEPA